MDEAVVEHASGKELIARIMETDQGDRRRDTPFLVFWN